MIYDLLLQSKPELDIRIGINHLCEYTLEYFGKFLAYLEKTKATRSHIASFRNLRSYTTSAITRFYQYTDVIGFGGINETNKRPNSASKPKKLSEKKRQDQDPTGSLYNMILNARTNEIRWKTTSAHKKK